MLDLSLDWHIDGGELELVAFGCLARWTPNGPVRIYSRVERAWLRDDRPARSTSEATERVISVIAETIRERERLAEQAARYAANERERPSERPQATHRVDIHERARRLLARCAPSIAGSNGAAALFHAAQVLVRGFNIPVDQALPLLLEYDAQSAPPWGQRECIRVLKSAKRRGRMEVGSMLNVNANRSTRGAA